VFVKKKRACLKEMSFVGITRDWRDEVLSRTVGQVRCEEEDSELEAGQAAQQKVVVVVRGGSFVTRWVYELQPRRPD
jgi:hypothetical protein